MKRAANISVVNISSSPELKAQVSFSDRLSSVVSLSVRKFFTLVSSSSEPLGQFQSILGGWGFKFVQMTGYALFQRKIITK